MPIVDSPAVEIMYVGGPTTVISIAGLNVITDPTFDPAGTDYKVGNISQHKTKDPALSADALPRLDIALVSHDQHYDNLDNAGRDLLGSIPNVFTTRAGAERLGKGVVGLTPWEERTIKAPDGITLKITATPARHGPVGVEKLTGEVVGFVISAVESGEDLVYVTGDTVWYEGTSEVARRFQPRVVMLFAGGALTARGPFYLTMNTNDAIAAANAFAESMIVPVHHEGWAHLTQSQDDLAQTFSALGFASRLTTVKPGRTLTFASRIQGSLGSMP
jgi:L-ascorbate metabolism protein UlaG (beta-lactamase superfamily)